MEPRVYLARYYRNSNLIMQSGLYSTYKRAHHAAVIQCISKYLMESATPSNNASEDYVSLNLFTWALENLGFTIRIEDEYIDNYGSLSLLIFNRQESFIKKDENVKHKIMEIIDNNKDNIKDGDYLELCNTLMKL